MHYKNKFYCVQRFKKYKLSVDLFDNIYPRKKTLLKFTNMNHERHNFLWPTVFTFKGKKWQGHKSWLTSRFLCILRGGSFNSACYTVLRQYFCIMPVGLNPLVLKMINCLFIHFTDTFLHSHSKCIIVQYSRFQ